MSAPICACGCGRPVADGYARHECALRLAQTLQTAAGHAEDAWDVIARQARVGTTGGTRQTEAEPAPEPEDLHRNPVNAFGWQASFERPAAGALRPGAGPADLGASDRYAAVENTITTWARDLGSDATGLAGAARWLAEHVDELRNHPAAGEAFDDLARACRQLERLVDRPPDRELVGVCDCGKVLYAAEGRTVVQCPMPTCKLVWNVAESRDILRRHLGDKLVTAAEAARFAAYWDERTSEQIRKLINAWFSRGQLAAHGQVDGDPAFRFGDVADRLAQTPRRNREGAAA